MVVKSSARRLNGHLDPRCFSADGDATVSSKSPPQAPPGLKSVEGKERIAEIDKIVRDTKLLTIQLTKQKAQDDHDRLRRQAQDEGAKYYPR